MVPNPAASTSAPPLLHQLVTAVWSVLRLYGWHLLGLAAVLYCSWLYLSPRLKSLYIQATAPPPIVVDGEKVLQARLRMQLEVEKKSLEAKEKREAQRRAEILEKKPKPKLKQAVDPKTPGAGPVLSAAAWGLSGDSNGRSGARSTGGGFGGTGGLT